MHDVRRMMSGISAAGPSVRGSFAPWPDPSSPGFRTHEQELPHFVTTRSRAPADIVAGAEIPRHQAADILAGAEIPRHHTSLQRFRDAPPSCETGANVLQEHQLLCTIGDRRHAIRRLYSPAPCRAAPPRGCPSSLPSPLRSLRVRQSTDARAGHRPRRLFASRPRFTSSRRSGGKRKDRQGN